jgi:hypothetical protein
VTQQERHTEDDKSLALTLGQNKPGSHVNVMEDYFYHLDNPVSIVPDVEPFYQEQIDDDSIPEHLSLDTMMEQYSYFENKESNLILKTLGIMTLLTIFFSIFFLKCSIFNEQLRFALSYMFVPGIAMSCFIRWTIHSKRLDYYSEQRHQFQDWIIEKGRQAVSFTQGKTQDDKDKADDSYETVDVQCSLKVYDMIRYQLSKTDGPEINVDNSMIDEYYQSLEDLKYRKKEIRHQMMTVVGLTVGSITLVKAVIYAFLIQHITDAFFPMLYSILGLSLGSAVAGFFLYRDKVRKDGVIQRLSDKVNRTKEKIIHLKQRIKKQVV